MSVTESNPPPAPRTSITCTKCGKAASVPFVPTAGRPVFCRDCFSQAGPGPASGSGGGTMRRGPRPSFGRGPPPGQGSGNARKRMMAQGRKTHFLYDAKAALAELPGGMDETNKRAFLEGLFARGARGSTESAQIFLDEKEQETAITPEQRIALGRLVERYSFYR